MRVEPILRQYLLELAKAYAGECRIGLGMLSKKILNDRAFLPSLLAQAERERGQKARVGRTGSVTLRRYDLALAWLEDPTHWPGGKPPLPQLSIELRPAQNVRDPHHLPTAAGGRGHGKTHGARPKPARAAAANPRAHRRPRA